VDEARQVAKAAGLKRNIRDTVEWQAAQKLLVEAIDSSKRLSASYEIRGLCQVSQRTSTNQSPDWAIAVDEVILKRSGC